ncbi:hydrogenase maturation protease [Candidatus Methylospira mobilis]|uniref:Hydrogenase maturation protease n=1 Tax=Candidatus Methylospira mobilis TaxID=1808979 RepID=A0A5Q0BRJ0_9GAMM|nr:hydrogenase maturation protease [Candidatus Methylospira mobilis]QFY44814.1 hydrogenase maturation protease [Candidatus Methylospira mobilis]WNV05641.1 hydrogenase maturation protease [Candidatus Methylospira mobilis]
MSAGLTASVLISACGNPSRGDDALGPLLLERLAAAGVGAGVELLCDFQFQPEHALDLEGRTLVLFVDAHVECCPPYSYQRLTPRRDNSYTTHAMSPWSVMQVYRDIKGMEPPPAFLLSLRGERFELGDDGLSGAAAQHLDAAASFCIRLLENRNIIFWDSFADPIEKL